MPVSTAPTGSVKPGIWNVDPGLVAPEGQWFYRDLADVAVLWEGGGLPYTLKQGIQAQEIENVVPQWVATPKGLGLLVGETANNDGRIFWDGAGDLDANEGQTIAAYVAEIDVSQISGEDFATTLCGYGNISNPSDGTDAGDNFAMSVGSGGDTATEGTVFVYTSGGNTRSEATGTVVSDGNPHFIVATWDQPASVIEVWVDGELQYTVTGYSDTSSEDNAPLSFGESGNRGVMGLQRQLWVGAWNRVWTPAQIRQLARYPFAPFRMGRRRVVVSTTTTLTADAGSYAVSGSTADLLRSLILSGDAGAYTVSGATASLLRSKLLSADAGTYSVAGQAADLLRALVLTGDAGSYTLTGAAATLAVSGDTTLTAEAGSYSVSGSPADLLRALQMGADAGAYTTSGQSADLLRALVMAAESGNYPISGAQADLLRSLLMDAEAGTLSITGEAATLIATGAAIGLSGPFLMHGEGPERDMDGEGPDRRMSGEGPDRDMSGEE